ncbi:hypothetical protein H6A18_09235 [Collinsella tanakaei]|uniref:hypothetical protein n=1 Tax=Collinsella tanakaei TaxID=626935 RepID=UPI00195E7A48|nr:hypothetical protein [Collinsella tanakaei]MBM6756684.1 hypothetical protein [Collinsella tanakaei]
MQPSEGFWEGVGASVGSSPGWMVIGALLVVGVLFVVAKYVYPGHKEIKMRELDIRQREAENDRDRIKANAALAENMRGLRESNDQLAKQSAALSAGIEESKTRSRSMGEEMTHTRESVDHIRDTTDDTCAMVREIHSVVVVPHRAEGTD